MKVNMGGDKGFKKYSDRIKSEWKTFDVEPRADYVYDINSGLAFPFKDNEVDVYYASMIFEHIMPFRLNFVLSEIYRTLKPQGLIRIVVPDIEIGIDVTPLLSRLCLFTENTSALIGYRSPLVGLLVGAACARIGYDFFAPGRFWLAVVMFAGGFAVGANLRRSRWTLCGLSSRRGC